MKLKERHIKGILDLQADVVNQQALIDELVEMLKNILDCDNEGDYGPRAYCSDCYVEAQMLITKVEVEGKVNS